MPASVPNKCQLFGARCVRYFIFKSKTLHKTTFILKPALIIFIKNARKGRVKTRLAATVGEDRALDIYRALLARTREVARAVDADRLLFYSDFTEDDEWSATDFEKHVQSGADLGARMANAFELAFKKHEKVVIIGSDCASLTPALVGQAFEALDTRDFVVGPAEDGGYYLLGMNRPMFFVFENMPWSTSDVLPRTLEKIEGAGKTFSLLPVLSDIDFEADWQRHGWEI